MRSGSQPYTWGSGSRPILLCSSSRLRCTLQCTQHDPRRARGTMVAGGDGQEPMVAAVPRRAAKKTDSTSIIPRASTRRMPSTEKLILRSRLFLIRLPDTMWTEHAWAIMLPRERAPLRAPRGLVPTALPLWLLHRPHRLLLLLLLSRGPRTCRVNTSTEAAPQSPVCVCVFKAPPATSRLAPGRTDTHRAPAPQLAPGRPKRSEPASDWPPSKS